MKKKDLNEIAKIEKAIKEKYGEEAIQNPSKNWNKEKENMYLKDLQQFYSKTEQQGEFLRDSGFLVRKKKRTKAKRTCPQCGSYSFSSQDDLYMTKFECCFECYVQYIEGREQRWNSGWRPNS